MSKTDTIHDAIVPVVASLGLDLYDLEMNRGILRISLTKRGGINLDELAQANNAIGAKLDELDPFSSRYTLEVSSPGFDRPLRTREHFKRYVGSRVHVESLLPRDGRRRWTGQLTAVGDAGVTLEVDGQIVELGLNEIKTARLVPDYGTRRE